MTTSNNTIQKFNFADQIDVRIFDSNNQPWFIASDVCKALGIKNHRSALGALDQDEKGVVSIDTLGGNQETLIINESGLYSLILKSRKPEAKAFKKWITSEVLPTLRKTGRYEVGGNPPLPPAHSVPLLPDHSRRFYLCEYEGTDMLISRVLITQPVITQFIDQHYNSLALISKLDMMDRLYNPIMALSELAGRFTTPDESKARFMQATAHL